MDNHNDKEDHENHEAFWMTLAAVFVILFVTVVAALWDKQ